MAKPLRGVVFLLVPHHRNDLQPVARPGEGREVHDRHEEGERRQGHRPAGRAACRMRIAGKRRRQKRQSATSRTSAGDAADGDDGSASADARAPAAAPVRRSAANRGSRRDRAGRRDRAISGGRSPRAAARRAQGAACRCGAGRAAHRARSARSANSTTVVQPGRKGCCEELQRLVERAAHRQFDQENQGSCGQQA